MNPPPGNQESMWTVDHGLFELSYHFRDLGFTSLECRPKSLVMQIPGSRKGLSGVEFQNFINSECNIPEIPMTRNRDSLH
jgi:hypothetical protein